MTTARDQLEEDIQKYVGEQQPGVFVTGYAVIATGAIPDRPGYTSYHYVVPESQPRHVSQGLASMLLDDIRFHSDCSDDEG